MSLSIRRILPGRDLSHPVIQKDHPRGARLAAARTHQFFRALTEPVPLLAMALAGPAFSLVRNGAVSLLLKRPAGLLTRGLGLRTAAAAAGLPAEVLTFSGTGRACHALGHSRKTDKGLSSLTQEWGALALTFGLFKVHGRLAQTLLPAAVFPWPEIAAAAGMYSGLVHAHWWGERLGWRNPVGFSQRLLDSAKDYLQLRSMGQLSLGLMGPRYAQWTASLEARGEQKLRAGPSLNLENGFLQPAPAAEGLWAMTWWNGRWGRPKQVPEAKPSGNKSLPRALREDTGFFNDLLDYGWRRPEVESLDRFIIDFFSRPENQAGIGYTRPIAISDIQAELPKVIPSLYLLEMLPERQLPFLRESLEKNRYFSKEFLQFIPPLVKEFGDEGKTPMEGIEFLGMISELNSQAMEYYNQPHGRVIIKTWDGIDYARKYLRGELKTPLRPPPPIPESTGRISSLTPVPPVPLPPQIQYLEPPLQGTALGTATSVEKMLGGGVEGTPPTVFAEPPTWEPLRPRDHSWYFRLGFWHYQMPRDIHEILMGRLSDESGPEAIPEGKIPFVPLVEKNPPFQISRQHANIARYTDPMGSVFVMTALRGDVTIRRLGEVIYLQGDPSNPVGGERNWLNPGDIVLLSPGLQFIFDPIR